MPRWLKTDDRPYSISPSYHTPRCDVRALKKDSLRTQKRCEEKAERLFVVPLNDEGKLVLTIHVCVKHAAELGE